METIHVPGFGPVDIRHAVLDFNGTIARDGRLIAGVRERIDELSGLIPFHIITADTFGSVKRELDGLDVILAVIADRNQDQCKADYVQHLGPEHVLCAGNGINDRLMLKQARIGVAVLGDEGLAADALLASDLVIKDILDLFGLLKSPNRLIAGLRT